MPDPRPEENLLEFLCPNGHKINCPTEQAGKAAKCPRCGVRFRIPEPAETPPSGVWSQESEPSRPELTDSGEDVVPPPAAGQPAGSPGGSLTNSQSPEIEFLCPNGHRLYGPADTQGHPGECPQCGAKFRIPVYDDAADEQDAAPAPEPARQEVKTQTTPAPAAAVTVTEEEKSVAADVSEPADAGHPLAELFARLWAEKAPAASVELHLGNGEKLVPDRFAETLSRRNHCVFAVQEPGGTHTLTIVAWDSIVRVLVRGVTQLPEEMG